ncbi:sensor histidine kinase [Catenulispora rubra]|uniref:sensor histidine kinase n=1 Tax=Catenulispora rubra TaxID=280293 RepID=UPI0018923ACD|nr:ATP-binding protein [Catenulispora rubra]
MTSSDSIAGTAVASGPASAPTAAARTETTLAWAWAGFRVGAAIALLATVATTVPHGAQVAPETVLTLVAVADCALLSAVCLRQGRIPPAWAAFDLVCVIAVVTLSTWPAVLPGPAGQSYLYDFTVIAAPTIGLPAWRPLVTMTGGAGLAFVDFSPSLHPGSSYPRWNALPDAVTIVGVAALAAVLARLLRDSAAALDRNRRAAVERASLLARQRERLRQQADLGTYLLTTVEVLVADDALRDPAITERLRAEAAELRSLIAAEQAPHGAGLLAELHSLVLEKAATGLHVDFVDSADGAPGGDAATLADALAPAAADALVAAAREALTNVRKHSGTDRAELILAVADGGVLLTIADRGRGYDASAIAEGFGQSRSLRQRITGVGGRVEIESAPGSGTQVRLWVPSSDKEGATP